MTPGIKTLLLGDVGTGKSRSIVTLMQAGLEVFAIFTEPSGVRICLRAIQELKLDPAKFHWRYLPPGGESWDQLIATAKDINMKTFKGLNEMEPKNKSEYAQYIEFLRCLANFTDSEGKVWGSVDDWTTERALAIDSWGGVASMIMELQIGGTPVIDKGQYGVFGAEAGKFARQLVCKTMCHVVLTGHLEKEMDPVFGGMYITLETPGKMAKGSVPKYFDDVVMSKRDGVKFSWSTNENGIALKAKNLPHAQGQAATFVPLIECWRKTEGG